MANNTPALARADDSAPAEEAPPREVSTDRGETPDLSQVWEQLTGGADPQQLGEATPDAPPSPPPPPPPLPAARVDTPDLILDFMDQLTDDAAETEEQPTDGISLVKQLMEPLKDSVPETLETATTMLKIIDEEGNTMNTQRYEENFEEKLEKFYGLCDLVEMHIRSAIASLQHESSSVQYWPNTTLRQQFNKTFRIEDTQMAQDDYIKTVRKQISFTQEIQETLIAHGKKPEVSTE